MSTNAERFIEAYNRIDRKLTDQGQDRPYVPFVKKVRESRLLVDPQRDFLYDCAHLRNAILHSKGSHTGDPIADPRTDVVERIERVADVVEKPPTVLATLQPQRPVTLAASDDLSAFLSEVAHLDYSQAPVRFGPGKLGLVTTNAMTRWFAEQYIAGDGMLAGAATLGEIVSRAESIDSLQIANRHITVVQAWRIFAGLDVPMAPAAIVLTKNGRQSETPLALVARSDVPKMLRAVLAVPHTAAS